MKKTLLVTLDFYPALGGVATYWRGLSAQMPADKWVVLAPNLPIGVQELVSEYDIVRGSLMASWLRPTWLPLFFHIIDLLGRRQIDQVVVGQILPVGTVVWLLSYIFGFSYVVSTHGMDVALAMRSPRKQWIARQILGRAEKVITVSQYTAGKLRELGCANEKISIIQGCPDVSMKIAGDATKGTEPILLTVGRLVRRKGHEDVIRALPQIKQAVPTVQYIIIGDGPYRAELERIASEVGVSESVQFLGALTNEEIVRWYMRCSVFIMPAKEIEGDVEGFGIVYLEANSYGKPVIGARSGGVADAVLDDETGLLVEPENIDQIAVVAVRLLTDGGFAQRLGQQGEERVRREYRWEVQAEKLRMLL